MYRIIRVCPNITPNWVLHHDNAPAHAAFSVAQFLTPKGITVMPQPHCSPDLALCDFFLFQKQNRPWKDTILNQQKTSRGLTQALNVCASTRGVLWRWPYFSWWINKIKLFFGTSLITLLSDLVHTLSSDSPTNWNFFFVLHFCSLVK